MARFKENPSPKGLDKILTELEILATDSPDYHWNKVRLMAELLSKYRPELEAMLVEIDREIGEIMRGIENPSEPRNPEHTLENLNLRLNEHSTLEEILNLGTESEEERDSDDKPTIH